MNGTQLYDTDLLFLPVSGDIYISYQHNLFVLFFACFCQLLSDSDSITFYRVEFITDRCFPVSIKFFIFVDVCCIIVVFSVTEIG